MRVSIIPRGERERGRAESALNEEIYGPWRGWRDDRFMPTRIGSSGPRVGRRTSEGKNGRMDGLAFSTKPQSLKSRMRAQTPETLQVV